MDKDHYGTIMSIPTTVREHVFRLGETERDIKEQREMYTLELALERGGVYGHSKKNINIKMALDNFKGDICKRRIQL